MHTRILLRRIENHKFWAQRKQLKFELSFFDRITRDRSRICQLDSWTRYVSQKLTSSWIVKRWQIIFEVFFLTINSLTGPCLSSDQYSLCVIQRSSPSYLIHLTDSTEKSHGIRPGWFVRNVHYWNEQFQCPITGTSVNKQFSRLSAVPQFPGNPQTVILI